MKKHVRTLRENMTDAEQRMWYYLRNRRLAGYKFVRQHVIGNYIVDFICREKNLIIEIDGGQHMNAERYDSDRTKYFEKLGYQVFRVWNNEVFDNMQGVVEGILNLIENSVD
jgi:very-short-patch-repair endonuclease